MNDSSNPRELAEKSGVQTPTESPSYWPRLGILSAVLALLLPIIFSLIHSKADRLLKKRIEKVQHDQQELGSLILQKRRYPFSNNQTSNEASCFYRTIEWRCRDSMPQQKSTSTDLPQLERGQWDIDREEFGIRGNVLEFVLNPTLNREDIEQAEIESAWAFADKHGQTIIDRISSGVHSDHVCWPVDLTQGIDIETCDLTVQWSAAEIALAVASKRNASEAIEIALTVNCFGRDHAYHPSILGTMSSTSIQNRSLDSLARRLNFEGDEPAEKDLRRIMTALGSMPLAPSFAVKFEALHLDSTLANLMTTKDPMIHSSILDDTDLSAVPEVIVRQWDLLDHYRNELAETWTLPLDEARALESRVKKKMDNDSAAVLARLHIDSNLSHRIHALACQSRTELIRIGAAAKLYRLKNARWPTKPADLSELFEGHVPSDPLAEGADFSFEVADENWTASARTVIDPVSITLTPRRSQPSRE